MNILFISTLFPNSLQPGRGRFHFDQLRALKALGCRFRVVAPVPWEPLRLLSGGTFPHGLPALETVEGFEVSHPRQLYVPLWRGPGNGALFARSVAREAGRQVREFAPDFFWAGFAFPEGEAVARLARDHRLPFVVSLLGSDINSSRHYPRRWKAIVGALKQAAVVLAKSRALKEIVVEAGIPAEKVHLDYNGVDQDTFRPVSKAEACKSLEIDAHCRRVLFVGNLVAIKDVPTLVRAVGFVRQKLAGKKAVELVLLGDGTEKNAIQGLARRLGIAEAVRMPGRLSRERVAQWMRASDVLCLPSLHEGVPNVVLESLASGRPVAASRVGGIPEVHPGENAGGLFVPGDVAGLADLLMSILEREWNPEALRALVSKYTWEENARQVMGAFEAKNLAQSRKGA